MAENAYTKSFKKQLAKGLQALLGDSFVVTCEGAPFEDWLGRVDVHITSAKFPLPRVVAIEIENISSSEQARKNVELVQGWASEGIHRAALIQLVFEGSSLSEVLLDVLRRHSGGRDRHFSYALVEIEGLDWRASVQMADAVLALPAFREVLKQALQFADLNPAPKKRP